MDKNKEMTIIVGAGNYPKIKNATAPKNYTEKISGIKTVAFIPDSIDENVDAFRRIISLIYNKKEAREKILCWKRLQKTGTEVAKEIYDNKHIMLANIYDGTIYDETIDQTVLIKEWILKNSANLKVVLLGRIACDNLYDNILKKLGTNNIVKYPHPTERSADYIYWRDIDYMKLQKKYDAKDKLINFF